MSDNWKKTTRILAAFSLLAAIIACGGSDDDDGAGDNTTATGTADTTGTAAAQPAGGPPAALELGAAPVSLNVPLPPSFNLTIATAGEYQIDATGASMDPEIFLYQGDQLVENNDDGGERLNSQIVRFLAPGTYSVRVVEHRARAFTAQVQAQQLQPLTPVGAVVPGEPLQVQFPDFPILQRPRNYRAAARAVTFTVAAAGQYTCNASATNRRDPKMSIIQNGIVLEEDDDSGDGNDAQIVRQFAAGTYTIRVWDWLKRGDTTITVTCNQG
ncbi:MAG TPA: hypothetical protein ENK57_03210 [Polyangiaceae bacterium]|nr:hypothetical protein [Polyangiaceae bacterium]